MTDRIKWLSLSLVDDFFRMIDQWLNLALIHTVLLLALAAKSRRLVGHSEEEEEEGFVGIVCKK